MRRCPLCEHRGREKYCPQDDVPTVLEGVEQKAVISGEELLGKSVNETYLLREILGEGGMGWVFGAKQRGTHRSVAIKVIKPQLMSDDVFLRRFYREASISAQLTHPNSIVIHEFGVSDDGLPFLVMEHLKGRPLNDVLRSEGRLPPVRALAIAAEVCDSLDEAHHLGLVHRDLKPANIFLADVHGRDDFVKVLDFGIAKQVVCSASQFELTLPGLIIGTVEYMSPEQAAAEDLDGRSDLYSLGVVLYRMLTGLAPIEARSDAAFLMKLATEEPLPLPSRIGDHDVPDGLRSVVAALLSKDRAQRPSDSAVVAEALRQIREGMLRGEPVAVDIDALQATQMFQPAALPPSHKLHGRETLPLSSSGTEAGLARRHESSARLPFETPLSVHESPPQERASRTGKPALAVAVVAGVLVAALGGFLALKSPGEPTSAATEARHPHSSLPSSSVAPDASEPASRSAVLPTGPEHAAEAATTSVKAVREAASRPAPPGSVSVGGPRDAGRRRRQP